MDIGKLKPWQIEALNAMREAQRTGKHQVVFAFNRHAGKTMLIDMINKGLGVVNLSKEQKK
jgi:hypothetical protein